MWRSACLEGPSLVQLFSSIFSFSACPLLPSGYTQISHNDLSLLPPTADWSAFLPCASNHPLLPCTFRLMAFFPHVLVSVFFMLELCFLLRSLKKSVVHYSAVFFIVFVYSTVYSSQHSSFLYLNCFLVSSRSHVHMLQLVASLISFMANIRFIVFAIPLALFSIFFVSSAVPVSGVLLLQDT